MSSSKTVVLITGANSGIGYATAKVIASAGPGYHVLVGSRNAENGKKAAAEISAAKGIKGSLSDIQLDVTDQASVDAAVKTITEKFGRLDVLVNNAALGFADEDGLRVGLERVLRTNVVGPAALTAALAPLLVKSKGYSIYISSGLGSLAMASDPNHPIYPVPWTPYRISKAALNMMAIQETKELGPNGVKTFVVCPGLVRSNLRGKSEEAISAGGIAGDPEVSGQTVLSIIQGKRAADVGKFVHKDGVYPW